MVVKVAIIGAGNRGGAYAKYILEHPADATVVAVADPRPFRRGVIQTNFDLGDEYVYSDWKQLARAPKIADAVVIAVLDDLHREIVERLAPQGYHILCEKPMATSISDCIAMCKTIEEAGVIFGVGHVLRYSPYNVAVKAVLDSGILGDIINAQHIEPVGYHYFLDGHVTRAASNEKRGAHSYVRGNWRREKESTFALMAKCCHDVDILNFYFGDRRNPAKKVSSFGSLGHFRPEHKPKEAGGATRCLDCAFEPHCPYSAKKAYLDSFTNGDEVGRKGNRARRFVDAPVLDIENVTDALKNGPYGECVYNGQNDVVDHQVVNIEYRDGATASLTMSAFSESECDRKTVIQGTRGELIGDMVTFTTYDFVTRQRTLHTPAQEGGQHGGGDAGITRAFIRAVHEHRQDALGIYPPDMLASHLLVFAAENARIAGRVIDFEAFVADQMQQQ